MNLKEAILTSVNTQPGIKGVELVLHVMGLINPVYFTEKEYVQSLESLIESGEIVEIEYVLAEMDYRVKSIYFPKGTSVKVA